MGKGPLVLRHPRMRLIVHRPDLHAPVAQRAGQSYFTTEHSVATPAAIKLGNLRRSLRRWAAAGCPLAPRSVRRVRGAICAACPHWSGLGNLGLGECRAPGCGCTRAKAWLATEACPLRKWSAVSVPADQT